MNLSVTMCGVTHLPAIVPQPYYDVNSELDDSLSDTCCAEYNYIVFNVSVAYMSATGPHPYDKLVSKLAERVSGMCLAPYDLRYSNVSFACMSAIPFLLYDDPGHKTKI
jgi:hypothetical protein